MQEEILYPSKANHRIGELFSKDLSNESKAHIARWYAEMMIKEFLSDQLECENVDKKSLSELIDILKNKISFEIINSLNLIKDFGDKASHYNPNVIITDKQVEKVVHETINLYLLIIIDELKKRDLFYHRDRATLISVLLPSMRVKIYAEFIDFSSKNINLELLWKWSLACLKNNNLNKATRKLQELEKKGLISRYDFDRIRNDLSRLNVAKNNDELPIPNNREDFARNLNDLLVNGKISEDSRLINERLLNILLSMADNIEPSSMMHYKGMLVF
ncbi:TPA: hypothetical protein PC537_000989 [Morganella morganii]|nr:hypothetical protein [Morganella morganii]